MENTRKMAIVLGVISKRGMRDENQKKYLERAKEKYPNITPAQSVTIDELEELVNLDRLRDELLYDLGEDNKRCLIPFG